MRSDDRATVAWRLSGLLGAMTLIVALVSCGSSPTTHSADGRAPTSTPNTGPVVDSRRFVGRSNASIDDSPGERIDLVVTGNMLVYDVSCNEVNVSYEVVAGVLRLGDSGSSTAVACSGDQDVSAPRFGELLSSQPTFALTGNTLTISSSFGELELLDASAPNPEDLPLLGTEWRVGLVVTDETGGFMSMLEPPPVVRFSADAVQLVFGCRTVPLTAIVDTSAATIMLSAGQSKGNGLLRVAPTTSTPADAPVPTTFPPTTSSMVPMPTTTPPAACDPSAPSEMEELVVATLAGQLAYEIDIDELRLRAEDRSGLNLVAALPPLPG